MESLIPFYFLFFCFGFFDTLSALVPLPTSPQNSSPLSSQSRKGKKNSDQFFLSSSADSALVLELGYFVFFGTLSALVLLPTSPENSSPLSSQSQKKKFDQFFLSSSADSTLVLELVTAWWVFFSFLSIRHFWFMSFLCFFFFFLNYLHLNIHMLFIFS